jgi:hypothetical protein
MTEVNATPHTMTIVVRLEGQPDEVYEGEIDMSQQQAADLKRIVGDGQAKVTASREISHKDYGNGGSVFVSITLTCDQTQETIDYAAQMAGYLADKNATEQHGQLQQRLSQLGITS